MTELARSTLPFLTFLENLRAPWMEKFFLLITKIAERIMAAIAVAVIFSLTPSANGLIPRAAPNPAEHTTTNVSTAP